MADVKLEYPALKVDGFDKSLQQCPPDELLPEGCSSRTLDILADLPEDVKGLYDIVNVTLLQGGLEDTPVPALRNMLAMLSEYLPLTSRTTMADASLAYQSLGDIYSGKRST